MSSWTPRDLVSSPRAAPVFEFDANDPWIAPASGTGVVSLVRNSLNTSQYLVVEEGSDGNPVLAAGNSGADGAHRVLQFHPTTIVPDEYDPATNWLDAEGVNGPAGSALVTLANTADMSTQGDFTAIIALEIDKAYPYAAGPIWGSLAVPGPLQYTQLRYSSYTDAAGGQMYGASGGSHTDDPITSGWHVMTMIKHDGTLIYRLDGEQVSTASLADHEAFTANNFMIGGGFPPTSSPSAGADNGVPPPAIGEFQAYHGVLDGSDLLNAEELAASSIGLPIAPIFANSLDAVGEVTRLYEAALARSPEQGGLRGWTSALESGACTLPQLAQAIAGSGEYRGDVAGLNTTQIVDRLYADALGRAADPSGEQAWVGALNSGAMSPGSVLVGFSDSSEGRTFLAAQVNEANQRLYS
ncbi:MAG: DUF4214 domain-containing protein [Acetobacteraceae bacterium]|nr:DUF4214 domain-containing protein [Acetobacteraceae bacterium]